MTAKDLATYTQTAKYSNYLPREKRRETKTESGDRMLDMHVEQYAHRGPEVVNAIEDARAAFHDNLVLGSQRAQQYGGTPILKKNARGYNCVVSYADRPRFFQEAFWLLLCGCGTGFSVQRHHVAKLPGIKEPAQGVADFTIPDTIEGWADALGVLLSSYFDSHETPSPQFSGLKVHFNYDLIRPEGSPLSSTSSGKAPGPEPLRASLEKIRGLLDRCLADGQERLRPVDVYDIVMHASDAVLAGGVRRSASICVFSSDDEEMATAKVGAWHKDNPQRGRSNNSALLLRDGTSFEDFSRLVNMARDWGEPGFYWADSTEFVPNPCVEIGMQPVDDVTGETGWQFCNLSTINMEACRDRETAMRAARAAAILGTLQAGYTDFEYLGPVSERITREEALLGVSMTGMWRNPDMAFDPDLLTDMAQVVKDTNEWMAGLLGINVAARATCLKPEGTGSLTLETSSGMTADHAHRYLRLVQANRNEPAAQFFQAMNPDAVEVSTWNRNGTDMLLTFCIEAPDGSVVKDDVDAVQMLSRVRLVKEAWVDAGKRPELCRHPDLSHNVSNTVHVRSDNEWSDAAAYIYHHRHSFAGVSLTSTFLDLDIRQAPNTRVRTHAEIVDEYGEGALFASALADLGLSLFDGDLWVACDTARDGVAGYGLDLDEMTLNAQLRSMRKGWVGAVRDYARRHFDGDLARATHCLKDVYLLARWNKLHERWVPVDYTQMLLEEGDNDHLEATQACAGGACEIG